MNVAGVRTSEGIIWVAVGEHTVAVLDLVFIRVDSAEKPGTVLITPDQLLNPPEPNGEIIAVRPRAEPDPGCDDVPGSQMLPLGAHVETGGIAGVVVALDVPNGLVTVRAGDAEWTLPVSNLENAKRENS